MIKLPVSEEKNSKILNENKCASLHEHLTHHKTNMNITKASGN